ncbi:Nucleolar protein 12 (25kDa) [Trypanosoma brucei equiperdum]|uniref:Nucleolar protein 12 (25kDa) n=1 Tax=Trypanosoma brucei equiperdum TaxID=630700 RepID=A0A3L6L020_9TRYP|nr:Nucleolar protein 12 (25kDa) [Trypanosoma brucei equiperdum]
MNRSTSLEDSDAGGRGGKKKREKKGFKVDRYENYRQRFAKGINGKNIPKNNSGSVTKRVKAITFDEEDRREYLSLHKRKNERRVKAFVEAKQKTKRDNARTRRAQREEARQAYNKFAAVPILPNFTYRLPVEGCSDNEDDDEGHMDEGNEEMVQSRGINDAQKQRRLLAVEKTVHTMPATMSGGALAESSIKRETPFFSSRVELGEEGAAQLLPLGALTPYEEELVAAAVPLILEDVEAGLRLSKTGVDAVS